MASSPVSRCTGIWSRARCSFSIGKRQATPETTWSGHWALKSPSAARNSAWALRMSSYIKPPRPSPLLTAAAEVNYASDPLKGVVLIETRIDPSTTNTKRAAQAVESAGVSGTTLEPLNLPKARCLYIVRPLLPRCPNGEMVDAGDLKSLDRQGRAGSSPASGTSNHAGFSESVNARKFSAINDFFRISI